MTGLRNGRAPCTWMVRGSVCVAEMRGWLGGGRSGWHVSLGSCLWTSDYSLGKWGFTSQPHSCLLHSWTIQGHSDSIFPEHFIILLQGVRNKAICLGMLLSGVGWREQSPPCLGGSEPSFRSPRMLSGAHTSPSPAAPEWPALGCRLLSASHQVGEYSADTTRWSQRLSLPQGADLRDLCP